MKKSLFTFLVLAITLVGGIYGFNYFKFQDKMNEVIKQDSRNDGIEVSVHFNNFIEFNTMEYDLTDVKNTNSMADVFRVLLQYAEKMKDDEFDKVILSFKGKEKFKLKGNYFKTLGEEYGSQNPVYTTRTFPENVLNMDGTKAFPEWTGGLLGVTGKQMEDFNDFHKKWYLNDY